MDDKQREAYLRWLEQCEKILKKNEEYALKLASEIEALNILRIHYDIKSLNVADPRRLWYAYRIRQFSRQIEEKEDTIAKVRRANHTYEIAFLEHKRKLIDNTSDDDPRLSPMQELMQQIAEKDAQIASLTIEVERLRRRLFETEASEDKLLKTA